MSTAGEIELGAGRFGLRRRGVSLGSVTGLDRVALVAFVLMFLVALFAPLLAPHPYDAVVDAPLQPPGGDAWLGTDDVGYDIFSRILIGLRASLFGAVVVVLSGVVIGGLIGLAAGATGGWVDTVLMRFTDLTLALPAPLLAIAVVASIGPGYGNTLLAVAIVWWPWYARITRGEVATLRARPHIEAARLAKVSRWRLWRRHLLPGAVPSLLVVASLDIGNLVLMLAGLSFLGLGAPAPAPELGAMSAQGIRFLLSKWWVPIFPGLAVALLAWVSNLAGDALRDLLDDR